MEYSSNFEIILMYLVYKAAICGLNHYLIPQPPSESCIKFHGHQLHFTAFSYSTSTTLHETNDSTTEPYTLCRRPFRTQYMMILL
jgi:hypothetical protein